MLLLLTYDLSPADILNDPLPNLGRLSRSGACGLMNCTVGGPRGRNAATLALAAGRHLRSEPQDGDAANDGSPARTEPGTTLQVYLRRTQPHPYSLPEHATADPGGIKLDSIALLKSRDIADSLLGSALANAAPPVKADVFGNADSIHRNRSGVLLVMDGMGRAVGNVDLAAYDSLAPFHKRDDLAALSNAATRSQAEFTVLILGDLARDSDSASINAQVRAQQRRRSMRRLDKLVGALLQRRARTEDLILVSASPPEAKRASSSIWSSLTPVLATGPDFPAGLLTSATTRTAGLVANSDLAPTILNLYHVPTPQVMEGRPISVAPMPGSANRLAILRRQDRMSRLNGSAPGPVMAPIGGFCFLSALAGIIARRRRGAAASRPFAPFMVFTQNMAAATLIAATLSTPSVLAYGIEIALLMALLTPLCYLAAQLTGRSPIVAGAIGGLALIAADTVTGQHMVKNSLFSGYALSGIRYYGVGNEFLGLTVGLGLMAAFALLDDLARNASRQVGPGAEPGEYAAGPPAAASRGPNWLIGILWVVLLFLLGWPAFGANAGSLPVCAVGFGLGWVTLRGGRVTWRNWLALVLLGILLMAAFGALDAAIWRSNGSHLASAASALQTGAGRLRLTAIAFRKMLMNLRLLVSPWLMLAAGVFAATILAARWIAGEQLTELLSVRQQTKRGLYALGAAAATALLLKDSGVVCATYLIGSACPITLYYLFTM